MKDVTIYWYINDPELSIHFGRHIPSRVGEDHPHYQPLACVLTLIEPIEAWGHCRKYVLLRGEFDAILEEACQPT